MTFQNDLATLIDDAYRAKSFREIAKAAPTALAGVSAAQAAGLADALQAKTIADIGRSKYVLWAQAIAGLAAYEKAEAGGAPHANMSLTSLLDAKWEKKSLRDVAGAPPSALAGLTSKADKALQDALGIRTIQDLATNRTIRLAQIVVQLAEMEGGADTGRRAA